MNNTEATVQSLFSKDLVGVPGKELSMIAVEYPPGGTDPVHTHHAQALVYVPGRLDPHAGPRRRPHDIDAGPDVL